MNEPARVLLVGFEDQDNLGLRYLSSRLRQAGHLTRLVAISEGPEPVLEAVNAFRPHIIGFSLIFQYLIPHFHSVLTRLRAQGVTAHCTIGGHYPSFEPGTLLKLISALDSVVRFEGEDTLLELAERVSSAQPWRDIAGIAYRGDDGLPVINPIRPGRQDLDSLPWPDRDDIQYERQRLPTASMIGGRGCPWVCSFCSIISFYEGNGTKGRRRRNPLHIVDEIEYLHRDRGARLILWQDDDFLAGGRSGIAWAHAIADECVRRGLHRNLRWKISCRSDEISVASLTPLVEAGLTHVYMGVESGDEENLIHLNKRLHADVHVRAGEVLRELDLSFDFGFMLFEPWSTFESVRNNLAFLRAFAGDGAAAVSFCRTLPYAGTALEARLKAEGRLREHGFDADYDFLDPRLDALYNWTLAAFGDRNSTASGTANVLRLLLFESQLDLPDYPIDPEFRDRSRRLTAVANRILLDTVEAAVDHIESLAAVEPDDSTLAGLSSCYRAEDERLHRDLALLAKQRPDLHERLHLTR